MDGSHFDHDQAVLEVRKACRQYAMQYFHFCKTLVETLGEEKARDIVQIAVFSLSVDRTDQLRSRAKQFGLPLTKESFDQVCDLPMIGWDPSRGRNHCPYAETWMGYFEQHSWFKEFALLYCNVIDTTNIENFTRELSHELTKNVMNGDETCDRVYFPCVDVRNGSFTYGSR